MQGRVGIRADIVVELACDRHRLGWIINALEAGLAAQAAIAVRDVVGQAREW